MDDIQAFNLAVLLLRCLIGVVMMAHGYNHIFGGGKINGTANWFESLGMKPGVFHAWLASVAELGGGAMLIAGLLTPLAASAVVATMLVAWLINHRGNGFFIFRPGEGWEYVMTLLVTSVVVAVLGAGEWSLDHLFDLPNWSGVTGLVLALLLGIGGGLATLAVFWRPSKST